MRNWQMENGGEMWKLHRTFLITGPAAQVALSAAFSEGGNGNGDVAPFSSR